MEYQNEIDLLKKKVMSTSQASKIWGLNRDYIKLLCREGKVAAFKLDEEDPKSPYIVLREQPNPKK